MKCKALYQRVDARESFMRFVDQSSGQGPNGDCWEWKGSASPAGYGLFYVPISYNGEPYTELAHRFAYELNQGISAGEQCVMHSCDNPPCVRPEHLSAGTTQDNVDDKVAKGRLQKGITHYKAKLDKEKIIAMRTQRAQGKTWPKIAALFGISDSTARSACAGRTYKEFAPS